MYKVQHKKKLKFLCLRNFFLRKSHNFLPTTGSLRMASTLNKANNATNLKLKGNIMVQSKI